MNKLISATALTVGCFFYVCAQTPVSVGRGSYASFPPAYESATAEHGGCKAALNETKQLWVDELPGRPIPTNDWWTDLLNEPFADALWSYPQMIHPSQDGVTVNYPTYWNENGTEVKSSSYITISAKDYQPSGAIAKDWHDWDVVMRLPAKNGTGEMTVTMAHGIPFTWFEFSGLTPKITLSATPTEVSEKELMTTFQIGDDRYAIFYSDSAEPRWQDGTLLIEGAEFLSVALISAGEDAETYREYAYSVTRSTRVDWSYDEKHATLTNTWSIQAENLLTPGAEAPVLQGFIPHAYKNALSTPDFLSTQYLTPRGKLKMAAPNAGNIYTFSYRFSGMTPFMPAPDATADSSFRPERLSQLMQQYAEEGSFGADTYWGGKGLVQMALNMMFAKEAGNQELFEMSRDKLKRNLENWLTYTPGEDQYYFAYFPRWGSLVGFDVSYDSDSFNDHHFHYGYFIYAGALLCMADDDFRRDYGEALKTLAKDYANWDRTDTRFPIFRTLDPWAGHSFAGGLGDGANSNGNGQESSSEAMQSWGGLYLLGTALGDKEMRDAGIFGWMSESRATREYWFDRDHIYPDREGNYDYTLYQHPYNSNITCKGIGWWNWFAGPWWNHAIQWMPVSPCLQYLSEDLNFARWDYEQLLAGTPIKWFEKWPNGGTSADGTPGMEDALADVSLGNVILCYLERFDPEQAATIFDRAYDEGRGMARGTDTGHISYYTIHSHLTYGDPDFAVYADCPAATAYRKADGTMTYSAYNNSDKELTVNFYRDGAVERTIKVPARQLVAVSAEPTATDILLTAEGGDMIAPGTTTALTVSVLDQYGASIDGITPELSIIDADYASISDGKLTISQAAKRGTIFSIKAKYNDLEKEFEFTVNDPRELSTLTIEGVPTIIETGCSFTPEVAALDQYGEPIETKTEIEIIDHDGNVAPVDETVTATEIGKYRIRVSAEGKTVETEFTVTPTLPNIALHKPVTASSEENAGCLAKNLTDGDTGSRWGSAHTDREWVYVDLGEEYTITMVEPNWEAAYGSDYLIQTATTLPATEDEWETILKVSGNSAPGIVSHPVNATGRYVRIVGTKRATQYGYSMYELSVHGISTSAAADQVIGLAITAPSFVDEGEEIQLFASTFSLNGELAPTEVSWSSDRAEDVIDGNKIVPAKPGKMTLTATTAEGLTSQKTVVVNEITKLYVLNVDAEPTEVIRGDRTQIRISGENQYGGIYPIDPAELIPEITYRDRDGNEYSENYLDARYNPSTQSFRPQYCGEYRLTYTIGDKTATVTITSKEITEINLALNKPATSTASEGANTADKINDGRMDTRWESPWSDGHNVTIDLQAEYMVNKAILYWEGAYSTDYEILLSKDGLNWEQAYHNTAGKGGMETCQFTETPARYVRLQCNRRALGYGNSVYEMEVYGTARLTDPGEATGINGISENTPTDWYTPTGICVARGLTPAEGRQRLSRGLYITPRGKIIL